MFTNLIWLLIATIAIQIPNLLSMQQATEDKMTVLSACKITLMTLPITIIATIAYTMFYGNGSHSMSYPAMSVYAKVAALFAAIIVQVVFLKSRGIGWIELLGLTLCFLGFVISVFGRK